MSVLNGPLKNPLPEPALEDQIINKDKWVGIQTSLDQ